MGLMQSLARFLTAEPRAQRSMLETRAASAGGMIPAWQHNRPVWLPSNIENHDTGAYRRVPLVFRCIQYLANAAGTAPIRVYDEERDEADDSHPLRQLLAQPNPGMGEGRFLSFIAMNLAVCNFVVIEKERDAIGNVIGLWPLRSDWIRPILRNQAAPDWEYRVPGRAAVILDADDVIPITYADTPDHSPTGIGPLTPALREAQITSTMVDFTKAFMDRGALPLYALVPSDDPRVAAQWGDQAKIDAFRSAFRSRYQGTANAVDPLPLVGIKSVERIGLNFNELAYADLNDRVDVQICLAFGIDPILLGAQAGMRSATFSNKEEARRGFYEDTMTYLWARIDDAFTRHLLPEFEQRPGWDIHFDMSKIPALQDDRNDAVTRGVSMFDAGLASRHVAQQEAGIEPHGPDAFKQLFNVTEVPVVNGQRTAESWISVDYVTDRLGSPGRRERLLAEPRIVTRDGRQYLNARALTPEQRAANDRIGATQRAAILRHAEQAEPIVSAYLTAQRGRVVAAVTGARSLPSSNGTAPEVRAVESIDWDAENDILLNDLRQWLDSLGADAFATAATVIGTDDMWRVSNRYLLELEDQLGRRIVGISETTRRDVERVVIDALHEGTSMPDLAEKLEGLYSETYANRSMTIARTESQNACNTANVLAYDASGVVSRALLHDNASHTTDPGSDGLTCSERNGLIVPLSLVGRHIAGEHVNGTLAVSPYVEPIPEGA